MNYYKDMALLIIILILSVSSVFAQENTKIKKLNWDGIDVVWLQDENLPSYDIAFYFGDGALGDSKNKSGETNFALSLIESGTRRYKRTEIADNLEYFGANYGAVVNHEYSTYSVSGLSKDLVPTMMKICHLFREANFPKEELKKEKKRKISSLKQIIQNQSSLANRAFRMVSLKKTPFKRPVAGLLKDIKRINRSDLVRRLTFLRDKTYKKIYINGPKVILKKLQPIIKNNCQFKGNKNDFKRVSKYKEFIPTKPKIILVKVPKTNKVEVRIGRFLNHSELKEMELAEFVAGYLGGGFSAKLMEELRLKKGLVYSVFAYSAFQKYYGRSAIFTSTKKDQLVEVINSTKKVLEEVQNGKIPDKDFKRLKNYIVGSHPFKFEKGSSYLNQLIFLDHIGENYNKIKQFKSIMTSFGENDLKRKSKDLFNWNNQYIFVLGDKSLAKTLKQFGKVKTYNWKKFL